MKNLIFSWSVLTDVSFQVPVIQVLREQQYTNELQQLHKDRESPKRTHSERVEVVERETDRHDNSCKSTGREYRKAKPRVTEVISKTPLEERDQPEAAHE